MSLTSEGQGNITITVLHNVKSCVTYITVKKYTLNSGPASLNLATSSNKGSIYRFIFHTYLNLKGKILFINNILSLYYRNFHLIKKVFSYHGEAMHAYAFLISG